MIKNTTVLQHDLLICFLPYLDQNPALCLPVVGAQFLCLMWIRAFTTTNSSPPPPLLLGIGSANLASAKHSLLLHIANYLSHLTINVLVSKKM